LPELRLLFVGLSPRRLGFVPRTVHVTVVVGKVALGKVFLLTVRFSPSVSFHTYFVFILIYILCVPEEHTGKFWKIPTINALSELEEHWSEKCVAFFKFLKDLCTGRWG
jgi:hypothetical protein